MTAKFSLFTRGKHAGRVEIQLPLFLSRYQIKVSTQCHAATALTIGKGFSVVVGQEIGGAQIQS